MKELINQNQIKKRLKELGNQISEDYKNKELTVVVTLKGAFITAAELVVNIKGDIKIEFIKVSSYNGHESTGNLKFTLDLDENLNNKNILIIEDIIDTGYTLYNLKKEYIKRGAHVKIMTLLDKPKKRQHNIQADYVGFEIENKFVVGFGLDDEEKYRELPYIGVIEN